MIKKILLTLVLCVILISCGKKGDPTYKSIKKDKINNIFIVKA
jgi:hypothetical protein